MIVFSVLELMEKAKL